MLAYKYLVDLAKIYYNNLSRNLINLHKFMINLGKG